MNDKELLDLAARALGWIDYPTDSVECGDYWHLDAKKAPFGHRIAKWDWNPLKYKSQALDLAIKLGICLSFVKEADTVQAYQQTEYAEPYNVKVEAMDDYGTCRAIVRVAAEIGSKMK